MGRNLTFFFLVLAIGFLANIPVRAETIHVATGKDYPPFTSPELEGGGFSTEVVRRVFERAGHEVEIHWVPWNRAVMQTRYTKFMGTFPYVKDEEREKYFVFSKVMAESHVNILTSQKNAQISSYQDVIGRRVCLPLGYSPGAVLQAYIDRGEISIEKVRYIEDCFELLRKDTSVFSNLDEVVAVEFKKKYPWLNTYLLSDDFTVMHFMISKEFPDAQRWIKIFDHQLMEMKNSGEFEELRQKYFP
jgi:polar amino acid transport system substrate-binding protein